MAFSRIKVVTRGRKADSVIDRVSIAMMGWFSISVGEGIIEETNFVKVMKMRRHNLGDMTRNTNMESNLD